jgi:hypothetical protein
LSKIKLIIGENPTTIFAFGKVARAFSMVLVGSTI